MIKAMTRAQIIDQCATWAGVYAADFDLDRAADIIQESYPDSASIDDIDSDDFIEIMQACDIS